MRAAAQFGRRHVLGVRRLQPTLFDDPGAGEHMVDPAVIDADPHQPRRDFDPAGLRDLMESIGAVGLIEPLVVTGWAAGRYRLVSGERRLRAIRLGAQVHPDNPRFHWVPVRVLDVALLDDLSRIRVQLDENRFREDLSPGEIAGAYRAARLHLETRVAERYLNALGAIPNGYDAGGAIPERRRSLKAALQRRGAPWPEVPWPDVFAHLGQPVDRRVIAILKIPDAVLTRCGELGLSKSAAAALAELPGPQVQMALLDAAAQAGDAGLVTPAADLLLADPSLGPPDAVAAVLAARRAVRSARSTTPAPPGQMVLPRPACPAGEFDRVAAALRAAVGVLESYTLTEYQAGSIRLLAGRLSALIEPCPTAVEERTAASVGAAEGGVNCG